MDGFAGKLAVVTGGGSGMGRELVRQLGAWRIRVGEDAKVLDAAVRARPEAAYDYAKLVMAGEKTTVETRANSWSATIRSFFPRD